LFDCGGNHLIQAGNVWPVNAAGRQALLNQDWEFLRDFKTANQDGITDYQGWHASSLFWNLVSFDGRLVELLAARLAGVNCHNLEPGAVFICHRRQHFFDDLMTMRTGWGVENNRPHHRLASQLRSSNGRSARPGGNEQDGK
jgi:hypothetical protein